MNDAFSVTQLNEYVKALIDSDEILQSVAVCGEISNFKNHYATGHLYFTLKDDKSLIKCVMFARDASRLRFEPQNGMTVSVWGRVSVFPRDGAYQLYAEEIVPDGVGSLYAAFEALKEPCEVTCCSDSKYVIDGLEKGWARGWKARGWVKSDKKPALNPDLWDVLLQLTMKHEVHYHWVKGHATNPKNNRCDELAVAEWQKLK